MIWGWGDTVTENVKCNIHILHPLLNHITPEGSTCGMINGIGFLNSLGEFNPKFMSRLVVSRALALNLGDYLVPLLEDPTHPPVKSWFVSDLCSKCKLSHLEWM